MKKSKFSVAIVAAIAAVAIVSGTIFAWFVADAQTGDINVGTGNIAFTLGLSKVDFSNILPGEPKNLEVVPINNTGSREALVKVDLNVADGKVIGNLGTMTDAEWAQLATAGIGGSSLQGDYTRAADGKVTINTNRLKELIVLSLNDKTNWVVDKSDEGVYYSVIASGAQRDLKGLQVKVLGELGGNVMDAATQTRTPNRPWEQSASFEFNVEAEAIQATYNAIATGYGTQVADDVKAVWNTIQD